MKPAAPARRSSGTTRGQLLARIHCIKHERAWSDDEYRDILHGLTGHRSAADLDFAALSRVVAILGARSAKVSASIAAQPGEWDLISQATPEKRPLLRKIAATCTALGAGRAYAEGIAGRQSGGIERRLEMCSYDELYRIAIALANTQRSRLRKAARAAAQATQTAAEEVPA
jgi:hypothetical protein